MIGLIQRVQKASVRIDGALSSEIGQGVLLLLGVCAGDTEQHADRLLHKVLNYRVFCDAAGKMNRSLLDLRGDLLVVSQFTLAADTRKGLRPSFSSAAPPDEAAALYLYFLKQARALGEGLNIKCGVFGADMQVELVNDGPVTFWLQN